MAQLLIGSICLSDIPKSEIKKVMCKDGVERLYLNIAVIERKEKSQYGDTHFISCAPKKEERKDDVKYIIADLREWNPEPANPTPEQIAAAPSMSEEEPLPF